MANMKISDLSVGDVISSAAYLAIPRSDHVGAGGNAYISVGEYYAFLHLMKFRNSSPDKNYLYWKITDTGRRIVLQ